MKRLTPNDLVYLEKYAKIESNFAETNAQNSEFLQMNEQIAAQFSKLLSAYTRYDESRSIAESSENPTDLCVEEFKNLYLRSMHFFSNLDRNLSIFRRLLKNKYEGFSHTLAEDAHVQAAEFDQKIGIVLPIPSRILSDVYIKMQYPHTSALRVLLSDSLGFAEHSSLFRRPISIHFLFNYDEKSFPCDHDNLQVSGWIDEITKALHIDDNGVLCFTHYASVRDKRLETDRSYVCITPREAQPMTPEQIIEFFLTHFQ